MTPTNAARGPYEIIAAYVAGTWSEADICFAFNNKLIERDADGNIVLTGFGAGFLRDVPTGTVVRVSAEAIAAGLPLWGANQTLPTQAHQDEKNRFFRDALNSAAIAPGPILTKQAEWSMQRNHDEIASAEDAFRETVASALDVQVGGDHYKGMAIQPVEFITRNKLTFLEGCVIKRMCRHAAKNGIEDLRKAKHEIDLLIQFYYGKQP